MADWGTITPRTRNRNTSDLKDFVDILDVPDGSPRYKRARAIGPIWSYAGHWFRAMSQAGKEYNTMRICLNYDPSTETFVERGCPYCAADPDDEPSVNYIGNFIDRELEAAEPMNKPRPQPEEMIPQIIGLSTSPKPFRCLLKIKNSTTWTPVRVWRATSANATKLKNFKEINTRQRSDGTQFTFAINDEKYGMDILLKFDSKAARANQWDIQRDQPSAITPKERHFHMWPLDVIKPPSVETANKDWNWLRPRLVTKVTATVAEADFAGGEAYADSFYGTYDQSDLEAPVILGAQMPLGTVGQARVNGQIVPARLEEYSIDGSQIRITLKDGRSGAISINDFRGPQIASAPIINQPKAMPPKVMPTVQPPMPARLLPGTIGRARINGQIVPARLEATNADGSQVKITLGSGQTTIIPMTDFRG
jgi:hypothetical protein